MRAQTPPAPLTVDFTRISGTPANVVLDGSAANPVLLNYGGELTVRAQHIAGDLTRQHYEASGDVRAHEADTTLTADMIRFDGLQNLGAGAHALLAQKPFTIRAEQLNVTPSALVAHDADFTTAPPDESPDYRFHVGTLSLYPDKHRGTMRNAAFYLFHTHLFTIRHVAFPLPKNGSAQRKSAGPGVRPSFGVSGRLGEFVTLGGGLPRPISAQYSVLLATRSAPETRLTLAQTLLKRATPAAPSPPPLDPHDYLGAIRKLATAAPGPLPEGDPLRFHDYLPSPNPINLFATPSLGELSRGGPGINQDEETPFPLVSGGLFTAEEASFHIASHGRRRDDLYVTRLPEVGLTGRLPLSRLAAPPPEGDSLAFRRYLRRMTLYADAQFLTGDYQEQPTGVHERRERTTLRLLTKPYLIGANTVVFPRLLFVGNHYSGTKDSYRYTQARLAVNRYFTDRSAVGAELLLSDVGGDSPFAFDVLDTLRELDLRVQFGDRRLAYAGLIRYDLQRGNALDYKLAIAPGLHGFTPVFSYNFLSRSIGFGVEVEGITF